jgi:hypothetical protein
MNEQEQKEYDRKKDFHLKCCKIFHDAGAIFGGALRAYADLRQYLIDNAEKVEECHEKYYQLRNEISDYEKI